MAEEVAIAIRLRNAAKFASDASKSARSVRSIGDAADGASRAARTMGGAWSSATSTISSGLGAVAGQAKYAALGLGILGAAGVKMGLSFNAQIESARLRFSLFTTDVDGLTKAVQKIDLTSAFSLADLSDAAALFGNSGIKNVAEVLQATANAAAASGRGTESLKSIAIALSQIQAKGRLSQEEINQLNEAGAPGAQRIIADGFQLTAKELQNIGNQGLDATEAVDLLTKAWTSGKIAKAAEDQTKTLGGQWNLLTGNVQKLSGAATESLAAGLRDRALPAVNNAVQRITEIFGREGLSNEQKIAQARQVIVRELGPVWDDISDKISEADIPEKLGDAVAAATPRVLDAMADIAPKAAKAFVDGWLHSGPEAQVITALFLGNKLRKSDFGKALFSGGGGGKGKGAVSTLLGTRGATPASPVFVTIVGPGGGAPGVPGAPGGRDRTPSWGKTAKTAGMVAGPVGVALLGAELAHEILPRNFQRAINQDNPSRAGGGSVRQQAASQIPAPGFGNQAQNITLQIDRTVLARTTVVSNAIENGRLAASRAASR